VSLTASTPTVDVALAGAAQRPWREAAVALGLTTLIVLAGELFGFGVFDIAARFGLDADLLRLRVFHPGIVAAYQLALLLALATWLYGRERNARLGVVRPQLQLWHWVAIIIGLYALKAAATVACFALVGVPPAMPGEGATPPAALTPFKFLMSGPYWPAMIAAGIIAAVVEELLYRGYLSKALEATPLGFWGGAMAAAAIWAALHIYYPLPILGSLVIVGIALSWLRARTQSVLPGMAWHALNNTTALIALKVMG
jgi:membrane protease YdiL (CAAX protease family)